MESRADILSRKLCRSCPGVAAFQAFRQLFPPIKMCIACGVGCLIALVMAWAAYHLVYDYTPVRIISIVAVADPVTTETFTVEEEIDNPKRCPGVTTRWLWRPTVGSDGIEARDANGDVIPDIHPIIEPPVPYLNFAGKKFRLTLRRPRDLPLGEWHYASSTDTFCTVLDRIRGPQTRYSPDLVLHFLPVAS